MPETLLEPHSELLNIENTILNHLKNVGSGFLFERERVFATLIFKGETFFVKVFSLER